MTKVSVLSNLRISGCELKDNYYISFILLFKTIFLPLYGHFSNFCRRHYKIKFDIDPGYIFRLLLQFHSHKLNTM